MYVYIYKIMKNKSKYNKLLESHHELYPTKSPQALHDVFFFMV